MTVAETIRFYARLKNVTAARAEELLRQMQIDIHSKKRVSALSGGMKQRLALAVALLADPPILVLDEPTANLDVQAQRDFIQTIQTLNHAGKTVVFSSHRIDEVTALASRVLVLANGELTLECSPGELPEELGLQRWLRVYVPAHHREHTLQVLEEQGFIHTPNGRSVYVQIGKAGKLAPLHSLQMASIPVEDFDLFDGELNLRENHD